MAGVESRANQQSLISAFLEIAGNETIDTARQFLQASRWNLEDAIQLFFANDGGTFRQKLGDSAMYDGEPGWELPPALPATREVLHVSREQNEIERPVNDWGSANDGLSSLYSPPFALMFNGSFEKAKEFARTQNRWLLVNVQSTTEFTSHMLNRDTWADEIVAQVVKSYFIFWQVDYDRGLGGRKVSSYYRLDSLPVVMVIDPLTGQKMWSCTGMIKPGDLVEKLLPFIEHSTQDQHASRSNKINYPQAHDHRRVQKRKHEEDEDMKQELASSMEVADEASKTKVPDQYPALPEEPKGDRSLLCRVGVRLPPNGRRVQRSFQLSDPIQLLWSFCFSELDDAAKKRPFRLTLAIPGSLRSLDYKSRLTFEKAGLANSMVSVELE